MELYCSGRPEACLGCGGPITAGDVVVPTERGWLLCLDCGTGLLVGQSLPAWPGAEPVLHPGESSEAAWTEVVSGPQRHEAMQAHPGARSSAPGRPPGLGGRPAPAEPDLAGPGSLHGPGGPVMPAVPVQPIRTTGWGA